jgi:hypothetical protein
VSTSYTYLGDEERYYPELGVLATPGMSTTLDHKPDDNWAVSSSKKVAAVKSDDKTES